MIFERFFVLEYFALIFTWWMKQNIDIYANIFLIILQVLRVAKAAVTEHWLYKVEKTLENHFFFLIKKLNYNNFFAYIFLVCQNIGENRFSASGDSPKWVKKQKTERKREGETDLDNT